MAERSIMSMDNIVPAATGINSIWLALLSYWTSSRISDLTARVSKLEAENKVLKKKLLLDGKRRDADMRDIVETLKDHDRRITVLGKIPHAAHNKVHYKPESTYIPEHLRDDKPKPRQVRVRDVEISESASESNTSESQGDEDSMSGLYEELGKKKKRR